MEYDPHYYVNRISEKIAERFCPDTLQLLMFNLGIDSHSLSALLMGNMLASTISTKVMLYRYRVCSSYDEVKRFKKSSAVAARSQIRGIVPTVRSTQQPSELMQVIVDSFYAQLSTLD